MIRGEVDLPALRALATRLEATYAYQSSADARDITILARAALKWIERAGHEQ